MLPEATFLVWCDFRKISDWRDVSRTLINDAKIALSNDYFTLNKNQFCLK